MSDCPFVGCNQTANVAFPRWPLMCAPRGRVREGRPGNTSLLIKADTFHYDQKLLEPVS